MKVKTTKKRAKLHTTNSLTIRASSFLMSKLIDVKRSLELTNNVYNVQQKIILNIHTAQNKHPKTTIESRKKRIEWKRSNSANIYGLIIRLLF